MIADKKYLSILDDGFPERVFKTALYLSLIIVAYSLSYMSLRLTMSIGLGCFMSIALCKALWWTIQQSVQNKRIEIKRFFLKISFIKYFIAGMVLFLVCFFMEVHAVALAIGLSVVMGVMVMKVGGKLLVNYLNRAVKTTNYKHIESSCKKKGV